MFRRPGRKFLRVLPTALLLAVVPGLPPSRAVAEPSSTLSIALWQRKAAAWAALDADRPLTIDPSLDAAADRHARELLRLAPASPRDALERALRREGLADAEIVRCLALGHSSGADILTGVYRGLAF